MTGKEESVSLKPCSTGSMEADEVEEQAISETKVAADKSMGEEEEENTFPGTKGTAPDATVEVDEKKPCCLDNSVADELEWSDCTEEDDDDDAILSEAEYQLIVDKVSAKYDRYMERLLARYPTMVFKDVTAADYADSDDEEVCAVHDHAKV